MVVVFASSFCLGFDCVFRTGTLDLEGVHDNSSIVFIICIAALVDFGISFHSTRNKVYLHQSKWLNTIVIATANLELGSVVVAPAIKPLERAALGVQKGVSKDTLSVFDISVSLFIEWVVNFELEGSSLIVISRVHLDIVKDVFVWWQWLGARRTEDLDNVKIRRRTNGIAGVLEFSLWTSADGRLGIIMHNILFFCAESLEFGNLCDDIFHIVAAATAAIEFATVNHERRLVRALFVDLFGCQNTRKVFGIPRLVIDVFALDVFKGHTGRGRHDGIVVQGAVIVITVIDHGLLPIVGVVDNMNRLSEFVHVIVLCVSVWCSHQTGGGTSFHEFTLFDLGEADPKVKMAGPEFSGTVTSDHQMNLCKFTISEKVLDQDGVVVDVLDLDWTVVATQIKSPVSYLRNVDQIAIEVHQEGASRTDDSGLESFFVILQFGWLGGMATFFLGARKRTGPVSGRGSGGLVVIVHVATTIGPPGELGAISDSIAPLSAGFHRGLHGSPLAGHIVGIVVLVFGAPIFGGEGTIVPGEISKAELNDGRILEFPIGTQRELAFELDGNVVGQGSSLSETPSADEIVFVGPDIDKAALDFVHVVLHKIEGTESLAIVAKAITGNNVRISPQSTSGSLALSEPFVVAVRGKIALDYGFRRIASELGIGQDGSR